MTLYQTTFICHCDEDGDFTNVTPLQARRITTLIMIKCPTCGRTAEVKSYSVEDKVIQ